MKKKGWKVGKVIFWVGLFLVVIPGLSFGQQYPTKQINLLVTFAPGGTLDASVRLLAIKAEKFLGQPFIISNNGGGAGSVALGIVKSQKPDGYNLTACTSTGLIRLPQFRSLPYTHEDFVPIMHFASVNTGVVVKSDSPYKTFKDLIEYARKNPGKVSYATSGVGSPMHLAMEFVARKENIQWTHVPYPGGAPGLAAVLGGHVTAMSDSTEWLPHVKEGTLRLLVSHGETRMRSFPNVPTLRDLGYDFINESVFIIAAPKGIPAPILSKLDDSFHKAMQDPEFVDLITKMEFNISYRNSADTMKYLVDNYDRLGKMIRDYKLPTEK
ncbi:MAG: tripartite tricarboxylate transporter substrate binding protein [Deltaproteobacteria bacterium]